MILSHLKLSKRLVFITCLAACFIFIFSSLYFALSPKQLAQNCLFFPIRATSYSALSQKVLGVKGKPVEFKTASGAILYGFYYKKPGAKYTFLLHYGQGGNIEKNIGLSKVILLAGQSVFTYDYEGYGMSRGKPSCKALVVDGLAAHDYLVNDCKIDQSCIIQYGVSLGTGIASMVADQRKCAGVFLISPYTSLRKASREILPYLYLYPDFMYPSTDLGSLEFISKNQSIPIFIWHGLNDRLIKVSHANELSHASKKNVTVFIDPIRHHGDWSLYDMSPRVKSFVTRISTDQ